MYALESSVYAWYLVAYDKEFADFTNVCNCQLDGFELRKNQGLYQYYANYFLSEMAVDATTNAQNVRGYNYKL